MNTAMLRTRLRHIVLTIWHFLLRTFAPKRSRRQTRDPKRILLINGAHMGDVVIATSLIPVLRSAFPQAEIGFLTGSWSHPVVRNHPDVAYTHCVDHWRMNRGKGSAMQKRFHYWKTRRKALREIRELSYDLSVSMHPWRADFLPLAWQAAIPVRLAFNSGLFAPLATAVAHYPEHTRFIHQSECQAQLLLVLGVDEVHMKQRRASLAPSSQEDLDEVCHLLGFSSIDEAPYCVVHMGAGSPVRELPAAFWREVASELALGQRVLFTGRGAREWSNAAEVTAGIRNCVNACEHLSWEGLVAAIRHARTFYGVDSMASHIAAALGTECIAMYAGMNSQARFRPEGTNCTVWSNALPCSACNRQFGCAEMTCMQGFDPNQILQIQAVPQFKKAKAS